MIRVITVIELCNNCSDESPTSENNNIMLTYERAISRLERSLAVNESKKMVSPPLNLMQIPLPNNKEHAIQRSVTQDKNI